jgi:phosphate/sulfate permease
MQREQNMSPRAKVALAAALGAIAGRLVGLAIGFDPKDPTKMLMSTIAGGIAGAGIAAYTTSKVDKTGSALGGAAGSLVLGPIGAAAGAYLASDDSTREANRKVDVAKLKAMLSK